MIEHNGKISLTVICGATATGKTGAAIELAKRVNGEIVSADSMQIYKYLDVGTAKPTVQQRAQIPHHLVDFLEPSLQYSAADYVADASWAIQDIAARGKHPIVVGGTGLYISSLINGLRFSRQSDSGELRQQLFARYEQEGIEGLYGDLTRLDPHYAATVHPNNVKRVIRGLELCLGGVTPTMQAETMVPEEKPYNTAVIWLDYGDREKLYSAIEKRIDKMLEMGLLQEARLVYDNRHIFKTAVQAIGYKEFFPYFDGEASLEQCISELKKGTRHYSKRQLSWFRRMPDTKRILIDGKIDLHEEIFRHCKI